MSSLIQVDDFSTAGALTNPPWSPISGSLWTSDGNKAYPLFNADQQMTMNAFNPNPSLPGPRKLRYEVRVQWPAVLPGGSQNLRMALTACQASSGRAGLWLILQRLNGGATNEWRLILAGTTSATDLLLQNATFTLAADDQAALTLDVDFNTTSLSGTVYVLSLSAFSVQPYSVNTIQWNAVVGGGVTDFDTITKYGGLFARVDGSSKAYADLFRIRDAGVSAQLPELHPEYTLTAAPTLTPITVGDEDDSTGDALTVMPHYVVQLEDQWQVSEFQTDGGHKIRTATQARARRRWSFQWAAISTTDHTTLTALHTTTTGNKKAFSWTDPETGVAILIRFLSFSTRHTAPGTYAGEAEVEEVFA